MPTTLETILSRLKKLTRNGAGWVACCPAHEDKKPSLSIDLSETGAVLLKCFAGCTTADVCRALNIKTVELFPEADRHGHRTNGKQHDIGPIVDRYVYPDENGKPVLSVTRHVPKTFKQWHPAPAAPEGWALGRKARQPGETDARLVLYRLPQILEAVALGHTIYVCEGEKDANALALAGLDSTTAAGGADQWLDSYTATLRGAHLVVIADKDEKGREGAIKRCTALKPVALSCKYLELPGANVKDPADFLARGGTARDLIDLAAAQPEFDPDNPPDTTDRRLPPLDLASEVCLNPPPTPELIIEEILHRGLKMIVGGPSKAHKSWTYLSIAISVALGEPWLRFRTTAANVLYLNFEVPRPFLIRRVIEVCNARNLPFPPNLFLWSLRGFDSRASTIVPEIVKECRNRNIGLIVLDPAYKMEEDDGKENEAGSVRKLLRHIDRLSTELNAAVLTGAHFAKGNAAQKEALDRISGSGVFARDPDVFMVLTPHQSGDDCFTVQTILRNLPPIEKFVVRWSFPLMVREDNLNPEDLKQIAKPSGKGFRRRPPSDFVLNTLKELPRLGADVTNPRNLVFSGAELREAFEKAGHHKDWVKDLTALAVRDGQIKIIQSPARGGEKFYGLPEAIDAWKPELNRLVEADRAVNRKTRRQEG